MILVIRLTTEQVKRLLTVMDDQAYSACELMKNLMPARRQPSFIHICVPHWKPDFNADNLSSMALFNDYLISRSGCPKWGW